MAKKRTRKQKEQVKHQYTLPQEYQHASVGAIAASVNAPSSSLFSAFDLYEYDTKLIKKDLTKTLVISLIILSLELIIYYLLVV